MKYARQVSLTLLAMLTLSGCNCGSAAPIIGGFSATPATLPEDGGTVTLAWEVMGATSLSIDHGVGNVTPVTTGSTTATVSTSTTFTLTAMASGGSEAINSTSVCVATGPVTLAVSTAANYVCQQNFEAAYSLTNGSCLPVTVTKLGISATVTSGDCGPSSPATYPPTTATVEAGQTATVFTLNSGPFCCGSPGCPAELNCTEAYVFTAETSAGTLTADAGISLDLGGCSTVCP